MCQCAVPLNFCTFGSNFSEEEGVSDDVCSGAVMRGGSAEGVMKLVAVGGATPRDAGREVACGGCIVVGGGY